MPALYLALTSFFSLLTTRIELKHPFQIAIQVRARDPLTVPSIEVKKSVRAMDATIAVIRIAIGRHFQSPPNAKNPNARLRLALRSLNHVWIS